MPYALIRGNKNVRDFKASPIITQFGIEYKKGAVRKDAVTLLMEQLTYDQSQDVRDFIKDNYPKTDVVCTNAVINDKEPVFVERPAEFVKDKKTGLWKIKEGKDTKLYTKADGFELPEKSGEWYIPVPTDGDTKKLMLYHPLTGTPLATTDNFDKAVKSLIPYLKQIWGEQLANMNDEKIEELAKYEISRFFRRDTLDGDASAVRRVCSGYYVGPRVVGCSGNPGGGDDGVGVRLFRWAGAESEAFSDTGKKEKPQEKEYILRLTEQEYKLFSKIFRNAKRS